MLRDKVGSVVDRIRGRMERARLSKMPRQQVFTTVYTEALWDTPDSAAGDFYSGPGSHDERIVGPYVSTVSAYLKGLGTPDVADLGCGDFAVGSKIRRFCGRYIAADIVTPLIERNRVKFAALDVDFRVIDIVDDELPKVDVLMIRQVLQHLSNADIQRALEKIKATCRYLIVTEHLPTGPNFTPNNDKSSGPDIRLYQRDPSGIVLTQPPFNLVPRSQQILLDIGDGFDAGIGKIQTIAYEL